jgi:hypothetical protein
MDLLFTNVNLVFSPNLNQHRPTFITDVVLQVSTLVKQMKKASEFLDFFSVFKDVLTR